MSYDLPLCPNCKYSHLTGGRTICRGCENKKEEADARERKEKSGRRQMLFLGPIAAILVIGGVVGLIGYGVVSFIGNVISADNQPTRCDELKDWYAENRYDSNKTIARDYYHSCGEVPPPVLNGELTMSDL